MRKPMSSRRSKYWCFTAYDGDECLNLTDKASYIIAGKEVCPTTGREHFQGYVEFAKMMRLGGLKKIAKTTHFEPRSGTQEQAIEYCKKDGDWEQDGDAQVSEQGRRVDLEDIRKKIESGMTQVEIATSHFAQWCQYGRKFEEYRRLIEPKRAWVTEVHVLWGESGTGKTRKAMEDGAKHVECTSAGFIIGYDGEDTVVFDEFDPTTMTRSMFLKLTDRYPLTVNVKGAERNWKPRKIYFTSNHNPHGWYGVDGEVDPAVERRFTEVHHYELPFKKVCPKNPKGKITFGGPKGRPEMWKSRGKITGSVSGIPL